jgi:phenylalanyl-tRNA synthetase beta chain
MKASHRWLSQLVPGLPNPKELADKLTHAGIEVEGLHAYGAGTEACVVAWVVSSRPHPSKSQLKLVTIDRGGTTQEVVCGAPNVPEPGGIVVLAPLGAHLPAKNMTIARREIAGVASEGMLCSEAELGLSEDAAGILVLPPGTAQPGVRFTEAVENVNDTILEIGLTPNRPDGLGHIGLAREAAALCQIPWSVPAPEQTLRESSASAKDVIAIEITDAERCPHYAAGVVEDVTIGPSPLSIRYRLSALGVRPISNAVDVTNIVLLEYGHPMHAFDLDRVRGGRIVVRRAKDGEKLVTLDGIERTLSSDDLLICDGEGPVALAGVMGGASSEINPSTKRILLECAYFDPRTVRRSSRRHGLHSESSHRFERGVDHGDTRAALQHAAAMTARLGGGKVLRGIVMNEAKPIPRAKVSLRFERLDQLLGVHVPPKEGEDILGRLGFEKSEKAWLVPTHRPDVSREVDLIEEIARVRGMAAIPTEIPAIRPTDDAGPNESFVRRARHAAIELGLSEALTYAFTSAKTLEMVRARPAAVVLKNPLSVEQSVMRTCLCPGLLEALSRARRHGERNVKLFTTGAIYLSAGERTAFAAVLAGDRDAWLTKTQPVDVWDAKGLAEGFVQRMTGHTPTIRHAPVDHLHPRGAAGIFVQDTQIGVLGPLHPDVIDAMDTGPDVMLVEIDLAALASLAPLATRFTAIPRFPAATRDVAFVVKETVPAGELLAAVRDAAGPLAENVTIFDRFIGGSVPAGSVSLALRVVYRSPDRTLTDAEVDASHARIEAEVGKRFGGTLRA